MTDWRIDERDFAGAEHLDADYVARYEAKAQFDPTEDVAALEALGMGPASTVIDLGAGTGVFAFAAAHTGAHIRAVDVSPAMVDAMRQRVDAGGVANVTAIEGGFLSYDHDRPAAMIKPGGIFRLRDLVFDMQPDEVENAMDAWLANAWDDPATGYTADDLAEHLRTEYSTFTWLLEPMLERVGFEILDRTDPPTLFPCYTLRRGN